MSGMHEWTITMHDAPPARDERGRLLPGSTDNPRGLRPLDPEVKAIAEMIAKARAQGGKVSVSFYPPDSGEAA